MEQQYEAVRAHNLRRLSRQLRDALKTLGSLRRLDAARFGGETSTYEFLSSTLEDAAAEAESMASDGESNLFIEALPQPPDTLVGEGRRDGSAA